MEGEVNALDAWKRKRRLQTLVLCLMALSGVGAAALMLCLGLPPDGDGSAELTPPKPPATVVKPIDRLEPLILGDRNGLVYQMEFRVLAADKTYCVVSITDFEKLSVGDQFAAEWRPMFGPGPDE